MAAERPETQVKAMVTMTMSPALNISIHALQACHQVADMEWGVYLLQFMGSW